jgi:hypothetical protein
LGRLLNVVNARAITIYLTHNIAIAVADPVDTALGKSGTAAYVGTVSALILLSVLAFGWIEDVAARRPVRLVPGGRRAPVRKRTAAPAAAERPERADSSSPTAPIPLVVPMPTPRRGATARVPAPRHTVAPGAAYEGYASARPPTATARIDPWQADGRR